jgi:hypothetical protein
MIKIGVSAIKTATEKQNTPHNTKGHKPVNNQQ